MHIHLVIRLEYITVVIPMTSGYDLYVENLPEVVQRYAQFSDPPGFGIFLRLNTLVVVVVGGPYGP